jgi:predicted transcriptional regulator
MILGVIFLEFGLMDRKNNPLSKVAQIGRQHAFLIFAVALMFMIILSTILPNFHETEVVDLPENEHLSTFESEEIDIAAPTPFIIPLYYKTPQNLFLNETRANIFELVSESPGITFGAITRELNLALGECQYHIQVLVREGYIKSKRTGKYTRYYLVGQKVSEVSQIQEEIILTIKENEGYSQTEIALELNISKQVVNYNIKPLVKNGFVLEIKENGRCCYYII